MDFLINENTSSVSHVHFPVSEENWRHYAKVVAISFDHAVVKNPTVKEGVDIAKGEKPTWEQVELTSIRGIIKLEFKSPDEHYTHIEEIWDSADKKANSKQIDTRVKSARLLHLFAQMLDISEAQTQELRKNFLSNPAKILEFAGKYGITDMKQVQQWMYFEYLVHCFNKLGPNGAPIYLEADGTPCRYRIKLSRQPRGKGINNIRLGTGNIIEKVVEGRKSILEKASNEVFDKIEVQQVAQNAMPIPTGGNAGTGIPAVKESSPWPEDV